jgi:fructose-bisphosphate aldolase class II
MFIPSIEILKKAQKEGYGVGAFNAVNMESAQAIFDAAEKERAPFILQITETTLKYTEPDELVAIAKTLAKRATVPVALHLDHGRSFETVMRFLRLGMTSVMMDGSLQTDGKTPRSYDENIEVSRKVVEAAHALGVTVEGEIGRLGQVSGNEEEILTVPEEAEKFAKDSGVDLVAIAIGTTHGVFKGKPFIAHERIKQIRKRIPNVLVMHGGTGVPDEDVQGAVKEGISKINIDTEIRIAFYESIFESVDKIKREFEEADSKGNVHKYDIRSKLLGPARDAMIEAIRRKMKLFGSSGKA